MSLHDPISPLRALYVQKVLPAVYDDSLSYYEVLAKTQEKLNEVISGTNDVSALVLELQQAMYDFTHGGYTDSFEEYLDEWFDENSDAFVQRLIDEGIIPEVEDLQNDIDSMHASITALELADTEINTKKVPYPLVGATPSYGTSGQVLTTNADGTTDWQDPVIPSDAQAEQVITQWLNTHPEATTTVQDSAITDAKINDSASILLLRDGSLVTDLNAVTEAGYYNLPYTASVSNCPIAANSRRLLTVYKIGNAYKIQSVIDVNNSFIMYYRWTTDNGTTWSEWGYETIQNGAITTAKLADGAVTTAKLANGSVTNDKLVQSGGVLDAVSSLNDALKPLNGIVKLESGAFKNDRVTKDVNANRIRNATPIPLDVFYSISLPDGYTMFVFFFDKDMQFINASPGTARTIDYVDTHAAGYAYANVQISKTGSEDSDISGYVETVEAGLQIITRYDTDTTLQQSGRPSDAKATGDRLATLENDKVVHVDVAPTDPLADLNMIKDNGEYSFQYSGDYTNMPFENTRNCRKLLTVNSFGNKTYVYQRLIAYRESEQYPLYSEYIRVFVSNSWQDWVKTYDEVSVANDITILKNDRVMHVDVAPTDPLADLDTIKDNGEYSFQYNGDYTNMPFENTRNCRKLLTVNSFANKAYVYQRLIAYRESEQYPLYAEYIRVFVSNAWQAWVKTYDKVSVTSDIANIESQISQIDEEIEDVKFQNDDGINNVSVTFVPSPCSVIGANSGIKLRVGTYNVAQWVHNHTTTDLATDKIYGFRNQFNITDVDILAIQEDAAYIDRATTPNQMGTSDYLLKPILPYEYGSGGTSIKSKYTASENKALLYSTGRSLRYALFNISNTKVLVVSTHPVGGSTQEAITQRATEYGELFDWVNGVITLSEYGTQNAITVPTFDAYILCGDFNSVEDDDKNTLSSLVQSNSCTSSNGGRLGWLETCPTGESIDNIIVSSGCILNRIAVYKTQGDMIYSDGYRLSDHYMMSADIIIT